MFIFHGLEGPIPSKVLILPPMLEVRKFNPEKNMFFAKNMKIGEYINRKIVNKVIPTFSIFFIA